MAAGGKAIRSKHESIYNLKMLVQQNPLCVYVCEGVCVSECECVSLMFVYVCVSVRLSIDVSWLTVQTQSTNHRRRKHVLMSTNQWTHL